jgi:hypothetical protein
VARRLRCGDSAAWPTSLRAEGPISEIPERARRDAWRSFDGHVIGAALCDAVEDSAFNTVDGPDGRHVRFVGPRLTVLVDCPPSTSGQGLSRARVQVLDNDSGRPAGPCLVTVLGRGLLEPIAHGSTDGDGLVWLAFPTVIVSLLVTSPDDHLAQTAWLPL